MWSIWDSSKADQDERERIAARIFWQYSSVLRENLFIGAAPKVGMWGWVAKGQ